MLSDDSELTELSSSEDDLGGSAATSKKATKGKQKREAYRLRNVLKPGRTTQYTAKALYDQIHQNDIELDPDYQRDVVWSDAKQIGLIDSIFRNFYVPPIIFSVTTEDDGTEKRICIDGKQRLTSIQKFIGGLIPHRDPFTNEKLWFIDSQNGPKRNLLPPQYKSLFQNKQIVCIEYSDLPGDLEREVFQRVQMGMALTTAEKLQAISGPWPDFIREIMQQYHTGKDGISNNMDLEKTRARDFQNVALTLFCIDHLPNYAYGTPLQLEKWVQLEDGPSDATKAKIHDVFRIYQALAIHKQLSAPFRKPNRVAPAEFIMAAVLIAVHKNTHSLSQLSQAIGILRAKTRAEHVDIRTNGKVYKTMFSIISKDVKISALKSTPDQQPAGKNLSNGSNNVSKVIKRKRAESSNEDSSEENNGDDVEYKPRFKKRNPPIPLTSASKPSLSKGVSFTPSQLKAEDMENKHSTIGSSSNVNIVQTGQTGLAKIRAAKLQVSEILGGTQPEPLPSTSSSSNPPMNSLPRSSLPPPTNPGPPNALLETVMMSQSPNLRYPPAPYPTPPLHKVPPTNASDYNGNHGPPGLSLPIPMNGQHYLSHSPEHAHSPLMNDNYQRMHDDALHSTSSETTGGGHRGRSGYDSHPHRERDSDRDRGRAPPHPRGSYSHRPENYYKPRDTSWDRRGSGYK